MIPKTIDNDTPITEFSVGFQSAVQVCTKAIDDLNKVLTLDKSIDVTDLMMKLIESVPTEELAEKVTNVMGLMSLK